VIILWDCRVVDWSGQSYSIDIYAETSDTAAQMVADQYDMAMGTLPVGQRCETVTVYVRPYQDSLWSVFRVWGHMTSKYIADPCPWEKALPEGESIPLQKLFDGV
jgi:hypothetical protein